MTLPSGNTQKFDVLVDFKLSDDQYADIEKKTAHIQDDFERVQEQVRLAAEEIKKANPALVAQVEAERKAAEAVKQHSEALKKQRTEIQAQIRDIRAHVREITTSNRLLLDQAQDIDRIAKPLATLGALTVGGIFAAANKYVKDSKEATATTIAWKQAQDELNKSGERIGAVLAKEALPLLKEAAQVTSTIAGFLQRNPEVAGAALKGGLIALTLGTIGKAVSGGIKLYADFKLDEALVLQSQAAQLQLQAARLQLEAAGVQSKVTPVNAAGNTPLSTTAIGGIGLGGALFAGIGATAANIGAGLFGTTPTKFWKDMLDEEKKAVAIWAFDFGKLFSEETGRKLFEGAEKALGLLKNAADLGVASSGVGPRNNTLIGGSQANQAAAVNGFIQLQEDIKNITIQTEQERVNIIREGEQQVQTITANYNQKVVDINSQYAKQSANITANYQKQETQAATDYAQQRADIIQSGADRIKQIEENAQKERARIESDFQDAKQTAERNRDALALQDAYDNRKKALAGINTGEEIAQAKAETQKRLQEAAQHYAQERAQRYAQYQQDLKDNAAKQAEALKQAAADYQAQIKQQREQEALKLKELQAAAQREQQQKQQQYIAQLKDLGVFVARDNNTRAIGYNQALAQTQLFINHLNTLFAGLTVPTTTTTTPLPTATIPVGTSTSTTTGGSTSGGFASFTGGFGLYPGLDTGGYATQGIYRMAWNGEKEFVMNGPTTKAAERAIGGQLNQNNLLQLIALAGNIGGAINYTDNATYGNGISARDKRDMQQQNKELLQNILKRRK